MKKEGVPCLFLLLVLCIQGCTIAQPISTNSRIETPESNPTHKVHNNGLASGLSCFYENQGQIKNRNEFFYGAIPGGRIGFGCSQVNIWLKGANNRLTLTFIGAKHVLPKPDSEDSHSANFFLGSDKDFLSVRTTASITYESLWPGIDLVYRTSINGAKYEFLVAPWSDPSQIQLRYQGHDALCVDSNALQIVIGDTKFEDTGLFAHQEDYVVKAGFVIQAPDVVCFQIGKYDISKPLVIDPLLYSSYFGGSSYDLIGQFAIDSEGYIYVSGNTESFDFPIVEAYNDTYSAQYSTCFVSKLTPEGDSLVYSTFIGGSTEDGTDFIGVDSSGCVYIGGWTWSSDFPVTEDAYDSSYNGASDGFFLKLNATGNGLVYSTFIGGSEEELNCRFTIDDFDSIIITGMTTSSDFPTLNALDDEFNEIVEFFVMKLGDNGTTLVFSTFIDGNGFENPSDIITDSSADIYIVGTNITGTTHNILSECFILKLSATSDEVIYNYCFGGAEPSGIAIDSLDNVYVTGYTSSSNFPVVNAYDPSYNGDTDCFVLKLDSSGEFLVYSTYIGGSRSDSGASIIMDEQGNVYVTGNSDSPNFPVVSPYQRTNQGRYDCVVFKLSTTGDNLLYSTYIGGSHSDYGSSILRDNQGRIYVAGKTWSDDFPTKNAYDDSLGGERDGIIIKLPDLVDSDLDGLIDYLEEEIGTDPNNPDSDGDQIPDAWEYYNGFDPSDSSVPLIEILTIQMPYIVAVSAIIAFGAIGLTLVLRFRKRRFREHG